MQRTQIITNVLEVQQVSTLAHFIAIRQTQQLLFRYRIEIVQQIQKK